MVVSAFGNEQIKLNKVICKNKKANRTFYHDRMLQWDSEKYDKIATKIFGRPIQSFYGCSEKDIETFLKDYFDEELELVAISFDINPSNGYDIWRFDCYIKEGD